MPLKSLKQITNQLLRLRLKYFILFFSFLSLGVFAHAQKISGLNIGTEFGASRFIMEVPTDFSRKIVEFDSKFGFTTDIELTKYLSDHWELGIDLNYTTLNGDQYNPQFSAEGHHTAIKDITEPVEYNNRLFGQKIFFRYYFISLNQKLKKVNGYPFINFGVGNIIYKSKFKYIDTGENDIIFGKGYDGFTNLSTAIYSLGGGVKMSWSSNLFLVLSINSNIVNYGFLDVMHNFDENGKKMDIIGGYLDLKIGIFYSLTPIKESKKKEKKKEKKKDKKGNKKRKQKGKGHLPFAK